MDDHELDLELHQSDKPIDYEIVLVDSTDSALRAVYDAEPADPRIFVSPKERAVGVSAKNYIIAVSEEPGYFAVPETNADIEDSLHFGLDPKAVASALEVADDLGFRLDPFVSGHPIFDGAIADVRTERALDFGNPDTTGGFGPHLPTETFDDFEPIDPASVFGEQPQPVYDNAPDTRHDPYARQLLAATDTSAKIINNDASFVFRYSPELDTFQANVYPPEDLDAQRAFHSKFGFADPAHAANNDSVLVGTEPGQFPTPERLGAHLSQQGFPPPTEDFQTITDHVAQHYGDISIVGIHDGRGPRLFTVDRNDLVTELHPTGKRSPDGFNWGYDGSGPTETSIAILTHTHGADTAADTNAVRRLTESVISKVDSTFAISGNDVTQGARDPEFSLQPPRTTAAQPAIAAVAAHLNAPPPPNVDLTADAPQRNLGPQISI